MKKKLFLILDIDGVLLEAHGYRLACIDTVNDYLRRMGQPDLLIDREITDAYEAEGIRAEWDMTPLILAAFINWYCEKSGKAIENDIFPPDCGSVRITDQNDFQSMLLEKSKEYSRLLDPRYNVLEAIRIGYENTQGKGLDHLWQMPIRDRFFVDTLNPCKCPFFAQLMNRILGTDTFTDFYGMTAPLNCESYLETKDILLISDHYRTLLPEFSGKSAWPAVMTYRPTRLPSGNGNKTDLYFVNTPEGDCALRLLQWTDGHVPMIGSGSLCYIEDKYHLRREYYVKPHPFHALASVIMTLCRDELKSLEIARVLCEGDPESDRNPALDYLALDENITLAVFEDSVTGINSAQNAAAVLQKWGYKAEAWLCGIRTTGAKNKILADAGAVLYNNINDALDDVLKGNYNKL